MTTGARIKARRKELGLSAEEIAKELSVSAATIYRYEKGDIEKLPGYILEPLSKILHTTPAYLMGWEDEAEQKSPTPEGVELNLNYLDLNEDNRAFIDAMIEKLLKSQSEN